jgi:hypothetical protein
MSVLSVPPRSASSPSGAPEAEPSGAVWDEEHEDMEAIQFVQIKGKIGR